MFHQLVMWLAERAGRLGYLGIVLFMNLSHPFSRFQTPRMQIMGLGCAANGQLQLYAV
jgi:hypothetical protein